ncbi:MAG: AAA family ATPase, partial [Rhodococcus sp.]|nr:AAA family ATPase [Rhodococcus sp. (in: high G+C Gram-positive bacteria)]
MFRRTFVGRETQLAALTGMHEGPPASAPWITVIEGPAGIGKTRLISEYLERAPGRVVKVTAGEFEQSMPLHIAHDIITGLSDPHSPGGTRTAEEDVLAGGDPRVMYETVRRALATEPTVLIVDDVNWVDEESLRLLTFLVRHRPQPQFQFVFSCRDGSCPGPLTLALAAHGHRVNYLHLAPLTDDDVGELLPDSPPDELAVLRRAAQGNPLYLILLAHNPQIAAQVVDQNAFDPADLPPSLPELDRSIRAEMMAMPHTDKVVASAAAVCGDISDLGLLCAVSQCPSDIVVAALDRLCERGILLSANGCLTFAHPLVRAGAYRVSGDGWRIDAHRTAANYLRERNASLLVRAGHLERSLCVYDRVSAAELVAAAELAISIAPATSARWLAAVLDTAPVADRDQEPDYHDRMRQILLLGRAHLLSGHPERALDTLQLLADAPGSWRGDALLLRARCERIFGRFDSARELIEEATAIDDNPHDGLAHIELATLDVQAGHPDKCAARLIALLTDGRAHSGSVVAASLALRSMGELGAARITAARESFQIARDAFTQLPDSDLADVVHTVSALGWAAYFLDLCPEGIALIDRAL